MDFVFFKMKHWPFLNHPSWAKCKKLLPDRCYLEQMGKGSRTPFEIRLIGAYHIFDIRNPNMDIIFLRNETLVSPNPHNLAKIPKNYLRTGVILNKWVRVVEPHLKSD